MSMDLHNNNEGRKLVKNTIFREWVNIEDQIGQEVKKLMDSGKQWAVTK